jgi:chromosome segregation ATPase
LAERDRTIAAVQTQLAKARRQPAETGAAPPATSGSGSASAAGVAGGGEAAGGPLAAKDAELSDAKRQIATLETRLESEVQRRKQVEGEMAKVLEETSSGPFEHAQNAVDQHLREQLSNAQQEVAQLRTTLTTERRDRGEIERRYAALQAQLERGGRTESDSEEVAALKERQRRVLASIQQDLAAAQQHEGELRTALAQQDGDGVSLADSVTSLRSENAALQRRLDDEHRQNRELATKLKLAGRVTYLIFKMQSSGATTAATVSQ